MDIIVSNAGYVEFKFGNNNIWRMPKDEFYNYVYNEDSDSMSFGDLSFRGISIIKSISDIQTIRTFNNFADDSEIISAIEDIQGTYTPPDPPKFSSAEIGLVDDSTIEITFDNSLDPTKTDGSFVLSSDSGNVTLSNPSISGAVLTMDTSRPILFGEILFFAYTNSGSNPLQNVGNTVQVQTFSNKSVDNNVPRIPLFVSASVSELNKDRISISYDFSLDESYTDTSNYSVNYGKTISSVVVVGNVVTLFLDSEFVSTDIVEFSYDNTGGNKLTGSTGGIVATLNNQSVTNNITTTVLSTTEEIINGTFDTDTDWEKGTGWTISGGEGVATAAVSSAFGQLYSPIIGTTYRAEFDVTVSSGSVRAYLVGENKGTITESGHYIIQATCTAAETRIIDFYALSGGYTGTVDNVTCNRVIQSDYTRFVSAEIGTIADDIIDVSFDELLDSSYSGGTFSVTEENLGAISVSSTSIVNGNLRVTLSRDILSSEVIYFQYTKSGDDYIRNTQGLEAVSMDNRVLVANNVVPPITFTSGEVGTIADNIVELTFSESLDTGKVDGLYDVEANDINVNTSSVAIVAGKAQLTLERDIAYGEIITFSYVNSGTNPLQNTSGTQIESFQDKVDITNNVTQAGTGSELIVNGTFVTDTDWIKGTGWTIGSGVANCNTSGSSSLHQTGVATEVGETYTISFDTTITSGKFKLYGVGVNLGFIESTNSYSFDAVSTNPERIVDFYTSSTVGFVGTIDNVSVQKITAGTNPVFSSGDVGTVDDTTAVISFDKVLATGNTDGTHTISASGGSVTTSNPTISNGKLVLTLSRAIAYDETLTYAYTNSGSNPLQDSSTNEVQTFTAQSITNSVQSPGPTGTIINVNGGFEDGTFSSQWRVSNYGDPTSIAEVVSSPNPVAEGTYSVHLACEVDYRQEMTNQEGGPGQWFWYRDWWLGIAMYFDGYDTDHPSWSTLIQSHTVPYDYSYSSGANCWTLHTDRTGGTGTPVDLVFHAGKYTLEEAWNNVPDGAAVGSYNPYRTPISAYDNQWNYFVVNWRSSLYNDGYIRFWHNGTLYVNETGPNIERLDVGGRVKPERCTMQTGIYKQRTATDKELSIYIDNIKIAVDDGSYALVDPTP
jgi:hypothetical protein